MQQLMLLEPEAPYVFSEFLGLQPSETENGVFGRLNNDYRTREGMYTFFFFFFAILFRGGWKGGGQAKHPKGPKLASGWGELVPFALSSLLN